MKSFKKHLDEAVEIRHDRYMRSHGKKASGTHGQWMFTHKDRGDVNYKDEKEVHTVSGKFSDAAKSAKTWAKKHGHSAAYVMESSQELDELSNDTLKSYAKKAGAEATGVKGKHLSPEKSNKRFDGHAKAMQRLTKESADQLDELSKETLRSYKHKAELSIPKDDREYANRSKGIDKAEKKLKEAAGAYKSSSEKSQFGGHRPHLKNPRGETSYLGATSYKTAKHAKGEAQAYHDGYFGGGSASEHGAARAVRAYREKHKEHIYKESVSEGWDDMMKAAAEKRKPQPNGGSGKKQGSRYGGSKQKEEPMKEAVEQLDELSPNVLHRYIKKAAGNMGLHAVDHGKYGDEQKDKHSLNKAKKRLSGITAASGRLADKANQANEELELDKQSQYEMVEAYLLENNIDVNALTEEQLDEIIGKVVGGAFKLGAKAAVGASRLVKKAADRMSTSGRADAAEKRAAAAEKKNRDRERLKKAQDRLRAAREAARSK